MSQSNRRKFPKLLHHKPSHRAYVMVWKQDGCRHALYLGEWGSKAAQDEYARFIERLAAVRRDSPDGYESGSLASASINELIVKFMEHAAVHYRRADGTQTQEIDEHRYTFRPLKNLFGLLPAHEFGPKKLKEVRAAMIEQGLCRTLVNKRTMRIRHLFKWAVEQELVPSTVHHALTTVSALQFGRTKAPERPPVKPVPDVTIDATLPILNRQVAGIIRFMRCTGCRPGEACLVRRCDIEVLTPSLWIFRPIHHKLAHKNKPREIRIGPLGQQVLAEFPTDDPNDYTFSPKKAVEELHRTRAAKRKTPRYRSHMAQNSTKRVDKPKKLPGVRYTTQSLGRAITKAIEKENDRREAEQGGPKAGPIPHWHPNQIRHTFGSQARKKFGLEAAQVLLGHSRADVTQVYAERDDALANDLASKMG